MQNCLGELNLTFALVYLDDVIVYPQTPEEHLTRLHTVFDRFAHHGLKLKPSKCHFFKETINYLGHEISAKGMLPGEDGIRDITAMAPPMTVTGVRWFIGATGYFRRFIKNFTRIAKPLNDLVGCKNAKLKNHLIVLGQAALEAFETLKKKCVTVPVLAFADLEKPFHLETDASGDGLGAVLEQLQEDRKYHPVAYASRSLSKSEKNYHSSKLEFLALKWAVTKQFKEYLLYKPFTVRTDNNPLTYILATSNLDATGHRWVAALADFNMKIKYLRGADNKVADVLSRIESRLDTLTTDQSLRGDETKHLPCQEDCTEVDKEAVNKVMERARFHHIPRAEAIGENFSARTLFSNTSSHGRTCTLTS